MTKKAITGFSLTRSLETQASDGTGFRNQLPIYIRQKWEKSIEDFIKWSLDYDMYCKMAFFGEDIERATHDGDRVGIRGPRNLLELLPDEFSVEDAKRVRQSQGLSNKGNYCIKMIRTWKNRGYVIQNTEYSFKKAPKFINK